ncbi:hypothetical protein [Dongia deserti]|uniref:hypothetical protein n=1 Tax=Dongia deserti TaxID=2268030 RepID=UPI000E65D180|nr:hypothetical protein [Dongia deserti]
MSPIAPFLETLEAAAKSAAAAEMAYRREAAERIKALERERSFAFRRANLMRPIADAVARAESEEMAVAGSQAVLRAKLGWSSDSEARSAILTQFAPVVRGLFRNLHPQPDAPPVDILASLGAFEAWYEATHRKPFWDLFDQPMPETPLVDF